MCFVLLIWDGAKPFHVAVRTPVPMLFRQRFIVQHKSVFLSCMRGSWRFWGCFIALAEQRNLILSFNTIVSLFTLEHRNSTHGCSVINKALSWFMKRRWWGVGRKINQATSCTPVEAYSRCREKLESFELHHRMSVLWIDGCSRSHVRSTVYCLLSNNSRGHLVTFDRLAFFNF
jgi:hypothetical protein